MGHSRRFLNLIVESNEAAAARSLRRIDLKRLQLFYPTAPPPPLPPPPPPIRQMETVRRQLPCGGPFFDFERIRRPVPFLNFESIRRLPGPILNFEGHSLQGAGEPCNLACYPFGQRKVLSTDGTGRNFLYDVDTRDVAAMPEFHKHKLHGCLSIFVPSGVGDGEDDGGGAGSLYLMVRELPKVKRYDIEVGQPSVDFVVLFHGNGRTTSYSKRLPLPAFVMEPIHPKEYPEIRSYAIVGGGSHICVSVDGRGTYTLDTASHTWDKIGDWTLPFHGKVEYVPELKLWFGLSGDARHLAAADLSTMDANSSPQLVVGHGWEEFQRPEFWAEYELEVDQNDVQLVSLGSGRFCIARFFLEWRCRDGDDFCFYFVVLTGVEVVTRVLANGEVKLEMITHKTMCQHKSLVDGAYIEQLF